MNIEYVGRNVQVDDQLRSFTQGKLQKVLKFLDEPIEVHVTLEAERHETTAELHLTHRHGRIHTRETGAGAQDSILQALDKAEKQARRGKKKHQDVRRRAQRNGDDAQQWPVEVVDRASLQPGRRPRVIKSSHIHIKPMTIDEAALALEGSEHDFVVFRDADSERINVLFRRRDEHYGLIVPEL
jgi:putative sigma-54 modulation protein